VGNGKATLAEGGLIGFGRRLSNASVIALHHALTSTVGSWRLSSIIGWGCVVW